MNTSHILIDYENVQPESLATLDDENFKVKVFVGANQKKLSFEAASAIQRMGSKAEYIQISGNGPNALDFHIAFYIGRLAITDPNAHFHIISKDTGFDPLIEHLKSKGISVKRSRDLKAIPKPKASVAKLRADKLSVVLKKLQGASKPTTLKKLRSTINALFQNKLPEQELDGLVTQLQDKAYVTVSGTKLSYKLPAS